MGTGVFTPSTSSGDQELPIGVAVGEYVIEAAIGKGGFGTVYRAVQPLIGKHVAIKVLARRFSADDEMVSRFVAEARAVNQIRHRHIIDIFSFGQLPDDGRHYYVMEHLEGVALDRYLAERGTLRVDEAMPILRAIARALDAAHAKGIAHRDLKPENIFLAHDGEGGVFPKLLDFGIAKLTGPDDQLGHKTATGVPIGTPYYMSPEQCRGRDVDHRTDIYSFGIVAYRVLTGAYPFEGEMVEILHKQMHEEPIPPSRHNPELTERVDLAIAAMMHKDAAQRPSTVLGAVVALTHTTAPTPMLTPSITGPRGAVPAWGNAVSGLDRTLAPSEVAPVGHAGTLAPSPRPRWLLPMIVGAVVAGALAFVVALGLGDRGREPSGASAGSAVAPDASVPPPDADVVAAPVIDATAPLSALVTIEVEGVPAGTQVKLAGEVIATAPGPVQLPRGGAPVVLVFTADGHRPRSHKITPDRDQPLALELVRKRVRPAPARPGKDDLARPDFGGQK